MKKPFLAKRIPFFGSVAMFVLCVVFFLVPFFARSARFAVDDVRNDVSDWLPKHFIETQQLQEFRDYFLGEQFVLISWDGCNEDDRNYHALVKMLRRESLAHSEATTDEEIEAHRLGDEYAWHYADTYHENVGSGHERWFKGREGKWFYITQEGKVYKWLGESDLLGAVGRFFEQQWSGTYKLQGEHIATFGTPTNNEFYRDPRKLFARLFKDVQTGPDFLEQLAGENGSLNIMNTSSESKWRLLARIEANQRLTGAFFGPTPSKEFDWTPEKMRSELSEQRFKMMQPGWQEELALYVQELIETEHGGDAAAFQQASQEQRLKYWFHWWDRINLPVPPRQTAIMVTLNGPVIDDLSMVVGRGLLGKPRGRILELATGECGISPDSLHVGGPPVDNVSIDEEGSITLLRLASLSGIIGISISLLSFRSLRVTLMLFFVGGVSALSSLGVVWMLGGGLDAILMTMPSLVYVLAISGSVHLINYYRDACEATGRRTAVSEAVKHAIFPSFIAAFTTAIGLFSLCTSNLAPIFKFGFYSGIAVMGTLALMFTYLPASLEVFPPNFARGNKTAKESWMMNWVERFWMAVGRVVTRHHWVVNITIISLMAIASYGILYVETSVQLLKLFQPQAKILKDYHWFEDNLGKLVPMEILVRFQDHAIEPFTPRRSDVPSTESTVQQIAYQEEVATETVAGPYGRYTLRDRLELVRLIRRNLETVFGPKGQDIIGSGMSIDVFTPDVDNSAMDMVLERDFDRLPRDFLYSPQMLPRAGQTQDLGTNELWRISLRLGAFSDVDYGRFVNEIKQVVEPSMRAGIVRNQLFGELENRFRFGHEDEQAFNILCIANDAPGDPGALLFRPQSSSESESGRAEKAIVTEASKAPQDKSMGSAANQAAIFSQTLSSLLQRKDIVVRRRIAADSTRGQFWVTPQWLKDQGALQDPAKMSTLLERFAVIVVVDSHPDLDVAAIGKRPNTFVLDATNQYQYRIDPLTKNPLPGQLTAEELLPQETDSGSETTSKTPVDVSAIYTGVIPIVYKAQRTLLSSLFESIFYSFVMIMVVMGLLLRPWGDRWTIGNVLNMRGGFLSMLPNVFPLVIVFGSMGYLADYGVKVDIGSMMTASVAMGIAVDDTIHFLTWYRQALADGATRQEAISLGYARCSKAMTQTTLIAGLGLFAFAFSSFTPTQRFGTLMLLLLIVALIGDLVFLPALISSPFGKYFGKELSPEERARLAEKRMRETRVTNPDNIVKSLDANQVVIQTSGPHVLTSRGSPTSHS